MITGKPDLLTLMKLTSHQGDINIIQSSANHYHDIGSLLLNDRYSDRVDVISDNNKGQVTDIMKEIYEEWLTEESNNCSWITLIDCFRQCGLYHLATSIEHHFEPLLPLQDSNGRYYHATQHAQILLSNVRASLFFPSLFRYQSPSR